MFYLLIFLIGISIGSFLNVLIDRLPNEKSIMGRSHCDYCKKSLAWYDLLPVISFFYLGGRCRYCKKRLSLYYPLVEVITGTMFIFVILTGPAGSFPPTSAQANIDKAPYRVSRFEELPSKLIGSLKSLKQVSSLYNNGAMKQWNNLQKLALLGIVSAAIIIFFSDLKYQIIPDSIQVSLFAFSFLYLITKGPTPKFFLDQVLAGFVVMLPILLLFLFTKGRAMGFGDVKLAFNLGFILGILEGLLALYIGFVSGAVVGLILIFFRKKRLKSKIAFGPFLVLGLVIMLFWGNLIVQKVRTMYSF